MSLMITTSNPDRSAAPQRVRSALFVDFDNVLSGLLKADPAAAQAFAERPERWAAALCSPRDDGTTRDLLVRRAYLNPNGWVQDPTSGSMERVKISRYRRNLTRAGFEVVDCPSLSAQHKNAADIRMVLDVMTALEMPTGYDEFIVASSDADFTPLLHRLRALDRVTTIMTTGATCAAYRNVAHEVIETDAVITLAGVAPSPERDTPSQGAGAGPVADRQVDPRAAAAAVIESAIDGASEPVNLPRLAGHVRASVGRDVVEATDWFGAGGFIAFLRSLGRGYCSREDAAWDPARHDPPPSTVALPPMVARFSDTTSLPRLTQDVWAELLATLSAYAALPSADGADATVWTQERLAGRNIEISRSAVAATTRLISAGGLALCTPPDSAACAAAITAATIAEARVAGWVPSDTEAAELRSWLGGVMGT